MASEMDLRLKSRHCCLGCGIPSGFLTSPVEHHLSKFTWREIYNLNSLPWKTCWDRQLTAFQNSRYQIKIVSPMNRWNDANSGSVDPENVSDRFPHLIMMQTPHKKRDISSTLWELSSKTLLSTLLIRYKAQGCFFSQWLSSILWLFVNVGSPQPKKKSNPAKVL